MYNLLKIMKLGLLCLGFILPTTTAFALQKDQDLFVQGELLIVPAKNGLLNTGAMGYKVLSKHNGNTPFLRIKLKKGETVLAAMNTLAANAGVAYVQPNYIYKAALLPNDPRFNEYWGLKNTGQVVNGSSGTAGADMAVEKAWDTNTNCSAITVAVIDTGVDYNHPDLSANIWSNVGEIAGNGIDDDANGFIDDIRGWDFVQGDNDPMDFAYHGTHVAGTIGASGNNATGGTGVCWQSTIMPLRALGSTGSGTTADIITAIDYATSNGAKVINMSLGGAGGFTGDLTDQAIARANTAGVLVVIAAGNSAADNDVTPSYPASYTQANIIAVAATTQTNGLASFSNFGVTSVDVGAPGTSILSTVPPARVSVAGCSWNFDNATLQGWTVSTLASGITTANTVAITTETFSSPSYSLTDTPAANYMNNHSYRAVSPVCNLSAVQGSLLNYNLELDTESNWDKLFVETSVDGITWTVIAGWSGSTAGVFYPFEHDLKSLDGAATAQIRLRLETDASVVLNGYHADDINITAPNTAVAAHSAADYAFLNGTSMATPNVAGAAALLWSREPALTHMQLRSRLLNNGDSLAALAGKTVSGKKINVQMSWPLQAATGLTATAQSASVVDLSWVDNSISESNYRIERNAGAGFITVTTVPSNTSTYSDTTAPSGTALTYRVVALARDGRTLNSATATVTTPVPPVTAQGGGGGCAIGMQKNVVDPLFPGLIILALGMLYYRRKYS